MCFEASYPAPVNDVGENTPPTLFVNSSLARFHAGRDAFVDSLNKNDIYNETYLLCINSFILITNVMG